MKNKNEETVKVLLINTTGTKAQVVKIAQEAYMALCHKQETLMALKDQRPLTNLEEMELHHASEILLGAEIAKSTPAVSALATKEAFDINRAYLLLSSQAEDEK